MNLKTKNLETKTFKRMKYEPITIKEPHKYEIKNFEDPQAFTEYYREHEDEFKGVSTLVLNRTYKIPGYRISISKRGKEDEELILRKDYYGASTAGELPNESTPLAELIARIDYIEKYLEQLKV